MELYGQRLIVHKDFAKILSRWGLTVQDLRSIAETVCNGLRSKGYFVPQRGILFTVDKSPNPRGFNLMFGHVKIEPENPSNPTAVINADSHVLEDERECAEKAAHHNKWEKSFMTALRDNMLMKLAHEFSHAFGGHRTNEQFKSMSMPDLEAVTDAFAFLSAEKMTGDAAYISVPYLHGRLKQQGIEGTPATIRSEATSIIASLKNSCRE
jgi:hypothetical protein